MVSSATLLSLMQIASSSSGAADLSTLVPTQIPHPKPAWSSSVLEVVECAVCAGVKTSPRISTSVRRRCCQTWSQAVRPWSMRKRTVHLHSP